MDKNYTGDPPWLPYEMWIFEKTGKLPKVMNIYEIRDIRPGGSDYSTYQGRLQYAYVYKKEGDEMLMSATLELILKTYWQHRDKVDNYGEAMFEYILFNDEMVKHVTQKEE